jgi:hypothetical protein
LIGVVVVAVWFLVDDPEPPNPAALIESFNDRSRVEECLGVVAVHGERVWICSFFRISPSLREQLAAAEPTRGADDLRVACFLGPTQGSQSDGAEPLGFAAPDRLTLTQRCREEIEMVRRRPSD